MIQRWGFRPEILECRTFVGHVEDQEGDCYQGVVQVTALAGLEKDEQVVQTHYQHGGVVAATNQVVGFQLVLQGFFVNQTGRDLVSAV